MSHQFEAYIVSGELPEKERVLSKVCKGGGPGWPNRLKHTMIHEDEILRELEPGSVGALKIADCIKNKTLFKISILKSEYFKRKKKNDLPIRVSGKRRYDVFRHIVAEKVALQLI